MQFNCDMLSKMLDNTEYVEIEDKKDELFFKRIDYIAMALSFKANMEFGSNMKQVKTYLKKVLLMKEHQAQTNADKINLACRVSKNLEGIVSNCAKSGVDIRDLSLKELSLAINLSWVIRKKSLSRIRTKVPVNAPVQIENAEEKRLRCFDNLRQEEWYQECKRYPSLVTKWMEDITELMVKDSIFEASLPEE